MPNTDSTPSIRVAAPSGFPSVNRPSKASTERVFDTEMFETYVARVVRKHLVSQFVDPNHQVLLTELRLIDEANERLRAHLGSTVPAWNLNWRVSKMIVTQHIRKLAEERLEMHDIDDDSKEAALEKIYTEDFESLFPADWLDS